MSDPAPTASRDRWILLLITAVELVVFLDTTVLNVALPSIGADLGLTESGLGWVTNAYLLAFGGCLLLGGRTTDLVGPRRMFTLGLGVFTLASLIAGLSPSAALLIGARAAQGVGAALLIPAQLALLTAIFTTPAARNRAFGVWSAMGAAGAAIGTAVGGPLTDLFGWPSIFLINVPVGLLALVGVVLLPVDTQRVGSALRELDLPGAVTATTALLLLGYGIGALGEPTPGTGPALMLAAGAVLLAIFVLTQARSRHPLMPLELFLVRQVSGSAAVNFLVGAAHVPVFALVALYLQHTQHYSPTLSGLAVLPVAVVNIVISRTLLPDLLDRLGARWVLTAGLALQALAMLWFARLPEHAGYLVDILPGAVLLGIGLPAAFVGVTAPAVTAVGESAAGTAAGIVNTAGRIGSGIGVTALLLLAQEVTESSTAAAGNAYRAGLSAAFLAAAALAVLGAVLAATALRPTPAKEAAAVG
ncbi:MFS transporter [Nocardia sp. NPDC050378]|uniref:MFS transporter n=1 Tax=Nocardia sp. NPDC050378 TaxID=3155400 RepID=UPI0033C09455